MPFRKISRDVKLAAIQLHQRDLLPLRDILECCGFSERTWFRILKLWRETGDVVNRQPGRFSAAVCVLQIVRISIACFASSGRILTTSWTSSCTSEDKSIHICPLHNKSSVSLSVLALATKNSKRIAKERNETLRAEFIARMAQYDPSELGFIDETSRKYERTPGRHYGWSKKGKRAEKQQVFVCGRRTSTEALLTLDASSLQQLSKAL